MPQSRGGAYNGLARRFGPDSDRAEDERVREGLRLTQEDLDALRLICLRPGRNAMAQVAALRLRLEYSQARPPSESRVTLDPAGPLTVRFDLSGMRQEGQPALPPSPVAPQVGAPERDTPPGGLPGAAAALAQASAGAENFPSPDVCPTSSYSVEDEPTPTLPRTVEGER